MGSESQASFWKIVGLIEIAGQRAERAGSTGRADRAQARHARALARVLRHCAEAGALDAALARLGAQREGRQSHFDALVATGVARDWRHAVRMLSEHVPVPGLVRAFLRAVHSDARADRWDQAAEILNALDACPDYLPLIRAAAEAVDIDDMLEQLARAENPPGSSQDAGR